MIETHSLRRTFTSRGGTVEAVSGVDLRVEEGEIYGFLGPNGAGKTTTLRMLATLIEPTDGQASVAGADLRTESKLVRKRIGYVGQSGGTDIVETGRSELIFQGLLHRMSRRVAAERAGHLLEVLDIAAAADRKTSTYSGGQRRRLDIAIGLMHHPRLIVLDEPTTGLDPQARAHLWTEMRKLRDLGTTVFLTTHYLDEADALCDRVAIIDQGRIVAEDTPDHLKQQVAGDAITIRLGGNPPLAFQRLEALDFVRQARMEDGMIRLYVDRGEQAVPALMKVLDGDGLELETLTVARPSLDDVFLAHTGRSLQENPA